MKVASRLFLAVLALVPILALGSLSISGLCGLLAAISCVVAVWGGSHAVEKYHRRVFPLEMISLGRKGDLQLLVGGVGYLLAVCFAALAAIAHQ
jgi:hypothetical protein